MINPFDITKAVDFSNEEIDKYWTNINGDRGFIEMLKPWSLMPIIMKGSKGSGKTHIMRYFSYELQKIRYKKNLADGLNNDKFIGVYIRCSGFNSNKFSGKGLTDEQWELIHQSSWELWVGERLCHYLMDMRLSDVLSTEDEKLIVNGILKLLPDDRGWTANTIEDIKLLFTRLLKNIDFEIQNFLFREDKSLHFELLIPSPRLTFGIPELLHNEIDFFKDKYVMYLIDELENYSEKEQRLIQILIREKPTSCTIRVGTRPYGIKTYEILKAIEENRQDSEFELIELDDILRHSAGYKDFIRSLCNKRLEINGYGNEINIEDLLDNPSYGYALNKILQKKPINGKGYINRLRSTLEKFGLGKVAAEEIISFLTHEDIIIERVNVMIFYRRWKEGKVKDFIQIAKSIQEEAYNYIYDKNPASEHAKILDKYKLDIIDTLSREGRESQPIWGFDKLVALSCGTPRTILNALKHAFKYESFNKGVDPFKEGRKITVEAQLEGVKKASDWFFQDNRIISEQSQSITDALTRIGDYLRKLRFSDVPPQCSINIFSVRKENMSVQAKKVFTTLINHSYIVKSGERRVKNSHDEQEVYQINTALLPKWELALGRRGLVEIEDILANCIFELNQKDSYEKIVKQKMDEYNAPFCGEATQSLKFDF